MWAGRGAYAVFVAKTESQKPLGRPGRRWENNIKADLQEIGLIWLRIGTDDGLL
jgi:hypothetical protein